MNIKMGLLSSINDTTLSTLSSQLWNCIILNDQISSSYIKI
jgi:hypothetical protein